jgi:hypothetical protein
MSTPRHRSRRRERPGKRNRPPAPRGLACTPTQDSTHGRVTRRAAFVHVSELEGHGPRRGAPCITARELTSAGLGPSCVGLPLTAGAVERAGQSAGPALAGGELLPQPLRVAERLQDRRSRPGLCSKAVLVLVRLLVLLVAAFMAAPALALTPGGETASGRISASLDGEHTYFVGESGAWVHNACYLVDTNILIGASRGNSTAIEFLVNNEISASRAVIREFLFPRGQRAYNYAERLGILRQFNVRSLGRGTERLAAGARYDEIYRLTYRRVGSHVDADLVGLGRALNMNVATAESAVPNLFRFTPEATALQDTFRILRVAY